MSMRVFGLEVLLVFVLTRPLIQAASPAVTSVGIATTKLKDDVTMSAERQRQKTDIHGR